jgi:hypothetical protein
MKFGAVFNRKFEFGIFNFAGTTLGKIDVGPFDLP